MPREFQFVAVLRPTEPVPFETRKLTHSHARRQTHAMKKRLRMQRLQENATQAHAENAMVVLGPPFLSLPSSIVSSRKDIFSVLPRPLSHQEHFLLDHCTPCREIFLEQPSHATPYLYPSLLIPATDVRIVVPHATATCHDLFSAPGDHQERVFREWVGLAVTDQDLLDTAVLLKAGRHLREIRPDDPVLPQMILLYKQRGLQRLRRLLSGMSSPVNALIVAMALSLAMDEVRAIISSYNTIVFS